MGFSDLFLKYEDRKKEIGRRILELRKEKGLTQAELLEQIYMSDKSVASLRKWEKGFAIPPLESLVAMASVFGCDIGYLLCDKDIKRQDIDDMAQTTGLSIPALENIIGMNEYGPSRSLDAINILLENSKTWRFLARLDERTPEYDPVYALANYLNPRGAVFHVRSSSGKQLAQFTEDDYVHSPNINAVYNAGALVDRTNLDALEVALKQLKKVYPK